MVSLNSTITVVASAEFPVCNVFAGHSSMMQAVTETDRQTVVQADAATSLAKYVCFTVSLSVCFCFCPLVIIVYLVLRQSAISFGCFDTSYSRVPAA